MRIYVPATFGELPSVSITRDGLGSLDLHPRAAHAVTAALESALADEDSEGLEYSALLAAADDDLALIAADEAAPRLRLVLTLEVPDAAVVPSTGDVTVLTPSAVDVAREVPGAVVVCAHVDEPEAAPDVAATIAGDDAAAERLVERDLLWYDASELGEIPVA